GMGTCSRTYSRVHESSGRVQGESWSPESAHESDESDESSAQDSWHSRTLRTPLNSPALPRTLRLLNKFNFDLLRNQSLFVRFFEEPFEPRASARSVVQRQLIHVHANELVGLGPIQSAAELLRVVDGFLPVIQRVRDAVVQHRR